MKLAKSVIAGVSVAALHTVTPPDAHAAKDSPTAEATDPSPVRWTGTVGVVSLPRVLSLELLVRIRRTDARAWDRVAFGLGADYLPGQLAKFGEATTLSWFQIGPEARIFPYRWFFVGARIGYQSARTDSEKFGQPVEYITTSAFLTPKVGALYTFSSGLTLGGDLGANFPLFVGTRLESDGQTDANARKVSKTFGGFVMPSLAFRIGWTI